MNDFPNVIDVTSKEILERRGFTYLRSEAASFWVSWFFENPLFKFVIAVDRGYFEAQLTPKVKTKQAPPDLIRLLRLIKEDPSFYQFRLDQVNRSRTLPVNEYVTLLDKYYVEIEAFFRGE